MNDQPLPVAQAAAEKRRARPPRSRVFLRLLWAIPGIALLALGAWKYQDVKDDGPVNTIRLTTKPGIVGQASEAFRLIELGNPDLYLKITLADKPDAIRTVTFKDMPIGNGLDWQLEKPVLMTEVRSIEVWDEDLIRDRMQDRMTMGTWTAEGQTFRVELIGQRFKPAPWALPTALAGGAIVLVVLLRFAWDQVI
jgi:hypothetical protein